MERARKISIDSTGFSGWINSAGVTEVIGQTIVLPVTKASLSPGFVDVCRYPSKPKGFLEKISSLAGGFLLRVALKMPAAGRDKRYATSVTCELCDKQVISTNS